MKIPVKTPSKNYNVTFRKNPLKSFEGKGNVVIVTDENVFEQYSEELKDLNGLVIPASESTKRLTQLEVLAERLIEMGCTRETTLVAFGGGVVGDLTGFLAAIYMRGIPFYHVPTSLLAMVDSSIGGKTGVNLESGKNLIGSFWQPEEVLVDPNFLKTLPKKEFINGMGEVVKHGLLNKELFEWLEKHIEKVMKLEEETLKEMIVKNIQIKVDIVSEDEREKGQRKLVNLGHTLGHVLEKLSGYQLPHGFAVAQGLVFIAKYAKMPEIDRLTSLLKKIGLPHQVELNGTPEEIVEVMMADKKRVGKDLTLVLPREIGKVKVVDGVKRKEMGKFLERSKFKS